MSCALLKKCSFAVFCSLQSETLCRNMLSFPQQSKVGHCIKVCKTDLRNIAFRSLNFMFAKVGLFRTILNRETAIFSIFLSFLHILSPEERPV